MVWLEQSPVSFCIDQSSIQRVNLITAFIQFMYLWSIFAAARIIRFGTHQLCCAPGSLSSCSIRFISRMMLTTALTISVDSLAFKP